MAPVASVETSVPPERAWAWWTDFGAVGSREMVDHGVGRSLRVVLAREGRRVVLEERLPLPGGASLPLLRHEVELPESGRTFVERSTGFEAQWRFEETPGGGTRIVRDLRRTGVGRLLPESLSRRFMERDLRTHARAMEADLRG